MKKVRVLMGTVAAVVLPAAFMIMQTVCGAFGGGGGMPAILAPEVVWAQTAEGSDETLSPYFLVKSDDPAVDQLPLKATSVSVGIAGVIADVRVTQVYKNTGQKPLEAVYVFPASTRAAVYGMKMTIGERTIVAEVRKREEARAAYERAKQEGKSASLLEQQRPNVFQMNVANILPGDEIKTELQYTELIAPTDGIYEFVYPTVVGPRYSNQSEATVAPSEKWSQNPYLHQGEPPTYTFEMGVSLATGVPIQEMTCASHKVDIGYEDPSRAMVTLAANEQFGGNRDFILKYRLAGNRIDSGLLLYEGKEENFFLLTVQPPKRFDASQIPPREYVFIVDVSGSMHGFPLDISKKVMNDLLGGLRPIDSFNVLLFSAGSQLLAEKSLPATPENIRQAQSLIDGRQGGGGTELLPALKRALDLPRAEKIARTLVIVTDGYVTVEPEAFELIRKNLGNSNFFSFGIGSSVNRFLIEGMARAGAGEPFIITKPDGAAAAAEKFRNYVKSPLLTGINLEWDGFEAYDTEPAAVPDVFAERPVLVYGKWRGRPKGKIKVSGLAGNESYSQTIDVSGVKPVETNAALRYLWARSRIAELGDYNLLLQDDRRVADITNLALRYNLLSAYTSFVAIDSEIRRKGGDVTTVKQALPLPEGVSDLAVGGRAYAPMAAAPAGGRLSGPLLMRESVRSERLDAKSSSDQSRSTIAEEEKKVSKDKDGQGLKIVRIKVSGGLAEVEIRKVLEQNIEAIRSCYRASGMNRTSELTLEWTIDSGGKVSGLRILNGDKDGKAFEQCLNEPAKKWRFPRPAGSGKIRVVVVLGQ
ncbi:MAG: VIT domain-containing protein [Syntrophobacteraceae bacterium]